MIHKPIFIKDLGFSLPHRVCFDTFNTQIHYGCRIGIMGRNGSGKTTLLKIIQGTQEPSWGSIQHKEDVVFGFVPQIVQEVAEELSGGQRFNKSLTNALSLDPNVLLLDEPTNHLDPRNRKNLLRMIQYFQGTLLVVSHGPELLRTCVDILWCVEDGKIHEFLGTYKDLNNRIIVCICGASVGYLSNPSLVQEINISLGPRDRITLQGDNASGKSTLVKGILGDNSILREGTWDVPNPLDIGYLDQHYAPLSNEKTVFETITELVPTWTHAEVRRFLNDFLFRKNEEVLATVSLLSGGERARISLAQIAAKPPQNLDPG